MKTIDTKGLNCPLPVLKAKKALQSLGKGEILAVLATDPSAPKDFKSFCEATGHQLVEVVEADGVYTVTVRKSA
ncbi:MAG: sulfurtransferase TusA family protein [Rhodospirillales bacterium]|nr:sulfurtransferase TusA family protein [Rhodospirillales bacterium]